MIKRDRVYFLYALVIIILLIGFIFFLQNLFAAPKKSSPIIEYRVSQTATQMAITGDLRYYGFIKHESTLNFALFIEGKIDGKNIQRSAIYEISQSMSAWQIASILLNSSSHFDCSHGCSDSNFDPELLPGGDLAPTISQKYEWVKTYEDCVKSVGHDGGQLSSEQNFLQTGRPRKCISPDGREFTQGKEGWSTSVGG
jgi:hypothetical protein